MLNRNELTFFGLTINIRPNLAWLLSLALLLHSTLAIAQSCPTDRIDQTGFVKHVFDGDTLQLSNGDKIRLVGINTPEMNYDKKNKPEPYAEEAKRFLSEKALHQKVSLRLAIEKKDRYGRKLAHVFLGDGTNLQAELIKNGLAFNIAIPPNLWQTDCYLALEKNAKEKQIGIWKSNRFKPLDAKDISQQTLGFYRVKGTIRQFKETKKSIWLDLTDNMTLKIYKEDNQYFPNLSEKFWLGKSVIGKGWITQKNKHYSMRIKHQSSLEIQ